MCGIVGYIGKKEAFPILIKGLKWLEYRGYDSAGVALLNGSLEVYKKKGKVIEMEQFALSKNHSGTIGIGHTRWATHGEPSDENAHPQNSMNNVFTVVHNGIIENYAKLKTDLVKHSYTFKSDTDTEVLANLIDFFYHQDEGINSEMAVQLALSKVVGAYGIAVLCKNEKNKIVVARKGSPLVVGLGDGEYFIASDAAPIAEYTGQVVYLNDEDIAILQRDGFTLKNVSNNPVSLKISSIDLEIGELDKGDFDYFMMKEIYEQPKTIEETFRGRLRADHSEIVLGGLLNVFPKIEEARRIIIIGCGTSWHAALIGEYMLEEYAQVPVEVEYASEFRYRKPVINSKDVVILISQSGETADTLAALHLAKAKGATVIGICNVVGSTLARETDAGVYTHAGVEIGVASTKAFTAQVTVLTMIALKLANTKGTIDIKEYQTLVKELSEIPEKGRIILQSNDKIKAIAEKYHKAINALYLGRGYLFPVALEGALKLKEISYIHAEGYAAGEMKHGPIALVDDNLPVVVVAPQDDYYEKIVSNIQEIKARKGNVIAIVTEGDTGLKELANDVIEIPKSHPALAVLLSVIPLQLLAYHIALFKGCNVDQPRNLAKSVTVE
ncbi:MAG: glutamine--fructose-6-phosphate transaminase (isomerizing) [Prolixibacteraceae bacterium]|jgi:glutamine---fructose-6-phosphate transaminase (isomerizing)|nr:glutamine--fructose-6-phosphate transaminase (isomerizing) [Prolixibacteraceae bacterium]MBT6763527.1 glutamine--fructose-6-phosphate transaminase (isomerizing) [Prolixibacteraceae bacterium]MBT6999020.1 glutamine--fructose-6-phosphate transaminase (isomerizing) [Prolixibacteraceae bacterium]MBT7394481.1 glutamine--fructose-6-phosphate transaminase (isomerizing) [Prolixibacteraceae bacterium]